MLRPLRILLAVLALAPLACDAPHPDDDGDAIVETDDDDGGATDEGDESGDDGDETGEAIDPTPVPFAPPLRKPCHATDPSNGARIRNCDP